MKIYHYSIAAMLPLFITIHSFAQNPYRIRVVDSENGEQISGVNVYIDEIPSSDKWTDANGLVAYNNLPANRKVTVHLKKEGYKIMDVQVMGSPSTLPDNNTTIKLEKIKGLTTILIWGRLEDDAGNNISKTKIVLSYLGQSAEAITDENGNYKFNIRKENFEDVKTYQLEAKIENCKGIKSTEVYYGSYFENKNLKASCGLSGHSDTKEEPVGLDFGAMNLIGTWVCELLQEGIRKSIVISLTEGGVCEYAWYHDGKYNGTYSTNWKYYDKSLIESDMNSIMIGKIAWNSVDDFVLTVIDNGNNNTRGENRHYVRIR